MKTEYSKLSKLAEVIFSIGHIGPGMLNQFITMTLMFYFTDVLESKVITAGVVGGVLLIGRITDGVTDPLIASFSDNFFNKKYGRRLPFLAIGTIPLILTFIGIWVTPKLGGDILQIIWLYVMVNAFYLFYTAVVNPYFSLLPDIAGDIKTRGRIQSYFAVFGVLGMGISLALGGTLTDITGSVISASIILALICLVVMLGPIMTLKVNKTYYENLEYHKTKFSLKTTIQSIKETLGVKLFSRYILAFSLFFFGFQLIQYSLVYQVVSGLGLTKGDAGTLFIISVVIALLFIPVMNNLVKIRGSEFVIKFSMIAFAFASILIFVLTSVLNEATFVVGAIMMVIIGIPYSGLMIAPNLVISRIIDKEHQETGKKNEAMFFGTQGLINKVSLAFAALTVGVLIDNLARTNAIYTISIVAAIFSLLGFILLFNYRIED